jgi:hypothetical protein
VAWTLASKTEHFIIIVDDEMVIRERTTVRQATKTLDAFRIMYPDSIVILAKEVISEDEL